MQGTDRLTPLPHATARAPRTNGVSHDGAPATEAATELRVGGARACVIVPAFQAAASVAAVIRELVATLGCDPSAVLVVDDGSTDGTAEVAAKTGATVVRCRENGGKGAALVRGFEAAVAHGYDVALTVDADGQHPAASAKEVLYASSDPEALVLGIRDLVKDGAPKKNQMSNGISNFFLSHFARTPLADTQCGLRRYPVRRTLKLRARARGYAFEAEVLLRALAAGVKVVELPVRVFYPDEATRVTHFDSVKDPMRIVGAVVRTLYDLRRAR